MALIFILRILKANMGTKKRLKFVGLIELTAQINDCGS